MGELTGIVADFEEDFNFITAEIYKSLSGVTIFSLLGNTIGALDNLEEFFLNKVENLIKEIIYL